MKTFSFASNEELGLVPCYLVLNNNVITAINSTIYFGLSKNFKVINSDYSRDLVYKEWQSKT